MPRQNSRLPLEGVFLLIALTLFWGINWPIMKMIVTEVPPLSFRALCLLIGGFGILLIARVSGMSLRVPKPFWGKLFAIAMLNIVVWNVLATYGLRLLPAGRSALLGYTMPIWTVLLSVFILKDAFTLRVLLALMFGVMGILALMWETLLQWFGHTAQSGLWLGVVFMLIAAMGWAMGTVLLKKFQIPVNAVVLTGWLLLVASVPCLIGAALVDGAPQSLPSTRVCWAILYNILIAFMFCYWAWVRLVSLVPVSVSSLSSLATPLVGVFASIILLNESPGWPEAIAAACILSAIGIVNFGTPRTKSQ